MKKVLFVLCAALMTLSASAADPVYLKLYGTPTYNTAAFSWSYYGTFGAGFQCIVTDSNNKKVVDIRWAFANYQYTMDLESIPYEVGDEYPVNWWVDTYWMLNAPAGMYRGEAWSEHVYEISDGTNSMFALGEGTYTLDVYELTESGWGTGHASMQFTLTDPKAKNLKATVAADNKTATLTWDQPSLKSGERLYVSVQSGSETVYDNYSNGVVATSPLTVDVKEGKTYSASVQALGSGNKAAGSQVLIYFTVGTNNYKPTDLNASVANNDEVTFTWTAPAKADIYRIVVYNEYGDRAYTVNSATSPVKAKLEAGSYTWDITPYEISSDNLYYPLSDAAAGNAFQTTAAPLPTGTVELNAWYMDAAYAPYTDRNIFDENDPGIKEGKYFWLVRLFTGENEAMIPQFWIYIYTDKNWAISGRYNKSLGNLYDAGMYKTAVGGAPAAGTNVDLKLNFQGFDFDLQQLGAYDGIYSGYCDITVGGTKYRININNLTAPACNLSYFLVDDATQEYYDMVDEDPNAPQAIETIVTRESDKTQKVIENGAMYILREGKKYNIVGAKIN